MTTQPSLPARTVEGLRLAGSDHVLEIGIGLVSRQRCSPAAKVLAPPWPAGPESLPERIDLPALHPRTSL